MSTEELPPHVRKNREEWDRLADAYAAGGERSWARSEITWGIFGVPESDLHLLPDVAGLDVVELGCGTAYVSAWLARRGARPVGIDNSPRQLETARRLQREHDLEFPLHLGNAEQLPFPDASFDLAISEYGACLWADPAHWVPEAARVLRPGGRLIFLTNGLLLILCSKDGEEQPVEDRLVRPLFGMHRFDWAQDGGIEFHLNHGDWIRLLRANGFDVEDLVEIQVPATAQTGYEFVTGEWASRWACEEVWKARKRG